MLALRLKPELENRLANLALKTGRTKTFYAIKAIEQQLDEMEDYYLAEQSYNDWDAEGKKTYSFDVNNTKKLKAIKIESDKWYVANILAVSGTGLPSEMSGIEEIVITPEEDDAIPVAYYNIQGIEVKNPSSGFYIVRYSNGTTKKIVIK